MLIEIYNLCLLTSGFELAKAVREQIRNGAKPPDTIPSFSFFWKWERMMKIKIVIKQTGLFYLHFPL